MRVEQTIKAKEADEGRAKNKENFKITSKIKHTFVVV